MGVQVEKLENNMAKLTIEASAETFIAALEKAYRAQRGKISIPGFRKGKAPRKMIQKMYGAGVFFEDAANDVINDMYPAAADECGETIVSQPEIDIVQIEEGKPFIFTAVVALKPEVTLGGYKGLEIARTPVEISEADVDAEIEKEREQNSRVIDIDDRPVQDGDTIKLDFEGFVDGVAFEGGKGTDYPLTIGSGSFIPGFEEQLIGAVIGEEMEVHVTFPENYQAEELRGQDAVFQCTVKEITEKELPELDDDFAQDVSEFDTMEEYRDDIRSKLLEKKTQEAKRTRENKAVEKAVSNAVVDIPEPMIEAQIRRMTNDFVNRIQSQGITLEQYMQLTGMTMENLQAQMRPDAELRIKTSLVLEAVAKAENIEISDEQVEEEIRSLAESYSMEPDKLKESIGEDETEQIREELQVRAAADLITDSAIEVDMAEEDEEVEEIAVDGVSDTDEIEEITVGDALDAEAEEVEEIIIDGVPEADTDAED
ncbi:MAG: trigger factor [Lachnospiraceae bacterium]|nr:trigger factor [Lachnospiraceae bacterium]